MVVKQMIRFLYDDKYLDHIDISQEISVLWQSFHSLTPSDARDLGQHWLR